MSTMKTTATAAALAAAGALVVGGAALANAATNSGSTTTGYGVPGYGAPMQGGQQGQGGPQGQDGRRGGQHTAASAAETTAVKNAVKAKDSTITVTSVQKDADGSFDAMGTKAGQPVMVDVSKDYKTVTVNTGGPGGRGGHGGHAHTAATAAQKSSVTAAVKAKDSAVTVTDVTVDPDGSYDVHGTKAGQPVMVEVSKDLKTVEVRTGGPQGGDRGQGGQQGQQGQQGKSPSTSPTLVPSASASA